MKIKRIKIHNIYSYYNAEFDLDDYNVIVGTNGSGKTNIVRILKLIAENQLIPENTSVLSKALNSIKLSKLYKLYPDEYSYVLIKLSLTKHEIRLILQSLFNREIEEEDKIPDNLHTLNILVYWVKPIKEEEEPTYVMCRFDNSSILFRWDKNVSSDNFLININRKDMEDMIKIIHEHTMQSNKYLNIDNIIENEPLQSLTVKDNKLNVYQEGFSIEPMLSPMQHLENENVSYPLEYTLHNVLRHIPSDPSRQAQDIINIIREYNESLSGRIVLSFWQIINLILYTKIRLVQEYRPTYDELIKEFQSLSDKGYYSKEYKGLEGAVQKIFGIKFDIRKLNDKDYIYIIDNNRDIPLEISASGYFEILYILSNILGKRYSIIILDEPALNLHPIKIKLLAKELKKLVKKSGNQVILITHSPYFVTYELLKDKTTNLLYIRKDKGSSKVNYKPKYLQLDLTPHLFNPNIFFSNCVILVEGSTDRAVLSAINDKLGNILDEYDISVVYCNDKPTVSKYIKLCEAYNIKYVAMVDDDYLFRWGKVEEDKERLIRELHDPKMKDKMKKNRIDPKRLYWINIDKINEIAIEPNKDILLVNDGSNELVFKLNCNKAILKVDDKQLELEVEKVNEDYYIYRDSNLKPTKYRDKDNIIILAGELEDELKKLGYKEEKNELKYYEFIDTLMKDEEGREKIKNSKFYTVLWKAFKEINQEKKFEEAWNKLNS